jgi:hypothetical protein
MPLTQRRNALPVASQPEVYLQVHLRLPVPLHMRACGHGTPPCNSQCFLTFPYVPDEGA